MVSTLLFITLIEIKIILSYSSCVKNTVFINKSSFALPALNEYLFFSLYWKWRNFCLLFFNQCFSLTLFNTLFLLLIKWFSLFFSSITYRLLNHKTLSQLKLKLYKRRSSLFLFFRLFSRKVLRRSPSKLYFLAFIVLHYYFVDIPSYRLLIRQGE